MYPSVPQPSAPREATGEVIVLRSADNNIVGFGRKADQEGARTELFTACCSPPHQDQSLVASSVTFRQTPKVGAEYISRVRWDPPGAQGEACVPAGRLAKRLSLTGPDRARPSVRRIADARC